MIHAMIGVLGILAASGAIFALGYAVGNNEKKDNASLQRADNYMKSTSGYPMTHLVAVASKSPREREIERARHH